MNGKVGVSILVSEELIKLIDNNPLTRSTSRSDFFPLAAVDYIKKTERKKEIENEKHRKE